MAIEEQIREVYRAFNAREIDAVFAHMVDEVDWPTASEGGRARGKEAVRAYWTRQWAEFDPNVTPTEIREGENGQVSVRVHQVVRDLSSKTLMDGEVWHLYTLAAGRITRMDVYDQEPVQGQTQSASPAWRLHS